MLSHCSQLEHVVAIGKLELRFISENRQYAVLTVRSDDDNVAQELPKIASLLPCPLAHFHHYTSNGSSKAALNAISDVCGANMKDLLFSVGADVDVATLQYLARSCNMIESLEIQRAITLVVLRTMLSWLSLTTAAL